VVAVTPFHVHSFVRSFVRSSSDAVPMYIWPELQTADRLLPILYYHISLVHPTSPALINHLKAQNPLQMTPLLTIARQTPNAPSPTPFLLKNLGNLPHSSKVGLRRSLKT
jgi:hypothetical protein